MPERDATVGRPGELRGAAERLADHAEIERLASDLLPALVARLAGTGLGELEVREGDWRVRLRRPGSAGDRRPAERSGRAVRGHEGPRRPPIESGHVSHASAAIPSTREDRGAGRRTPLVATSPAVGIFRARQEVRPGSHVRPGDRLGIVDLLGVPQEVRASVEAVVAAQFVEDGDAVEYGQALLALEPVGSPEHEPVPQALPVG